VADIKAEQRPDSFRPARANPDLCTGECGPVLRFPALPEAAVTEGATLVGGSLE